MKIVRSVALTLVGCALLALWATPARAMPSFARATHQPCTTCHVQFPKPNEFGKAFKQRGYRLPDQEGTYVWDQTDVPMSGMVALTYERADQGTAGTTGTADRRALDFAAAGTLGPTVSFHLDYGFETETYTDSGADTVDVSTAVPGATFLIFNDLLPDSRLNLKAGVMDNDFMYLSSPRRTTFADYLSPVTLDHTGIEANGMAGDLRYAVGFGDDEMVGVSGVSNNLRGGYGWATYSVAGQTVGARLYAAQAGSSPAADGTHTQWEVNADPHGGPPNLMLGYYTQDNVDGVTDDKRTNFLAEVVVPAARQVLVTGRYEMQDTKVGGVSTPGTDTLEVANVSYYILPNISISAEFSALDEEESNAKENKVTLGFNVGI